MHIGARLAELARTRGGHVAIVDDAGRWSSSRFHARIVRFGNAVLQGSNYYAQHVGDPKVYLVSPSVFGDAQTLLAQLPKKPTPTPTSPPTDTPLPITPSASPAGTPAATDTPKP